jgi:hypothetical protein
MSEMSAAQRVMRARMGGLMTSALGHVNTAPARKAFDDRFVDQVDPERKLSFSERTRRAEAARRLYMTRLALRSSVVRGNKKATPVIVSPGAAEPEVRRDRAASTG